MLTDEQLVEVRNEFISLLGSIKREGCDIDGLIGYLDSKGFFEAPATSKYYCSFDGGLMLHSINTYKTLKRLVKGFASKKVAKSNENGEGSVEIVPNYSDDTMLILGLLSMVYKADLYEKYSKNEKFYSKYGKSKDALGHFDWQSTLGYKVVDENEREVFGDNGFAAYFIISEFIPLTKEESIILANFNEILSDDANKASMYQILSKYPLASLLMSASLIASYCVETTAKQ